MLFPLLHLIDIKELLQIFLEVMMKKMEHRGTGILVQKHKNY